LSCVQGTAGDGSCEKEGYYTFCCKNEKGGEYVNKKDVVQWPNCKSTEKALSSQSLAMWLWMDTDDLDCPALNPAGTSDQCGNNWEGGIWCAH
jgi:hypothetical protein